MNKQDIKKIHKAGLTPIRKGLINPTIDKHGEKGWEILGSFPNIESRDEVYYSLLDSDKIIGIEE